MRDGEEIGISGIQGPDTGNSLCGRSGEEGGSVSKYGDMIGLPHPESASHPLMSLENRAAQFSPFAALTGHSAAIEETARLTEERVELDESRIAFLDERLQMIRENLAGKPEITFVCFRPDERKEGGRYLTVTGRVIKMDSMKHLIILEDGTGLEMENLVSIEGDLFGSQ